MSKTSCVTTGMGVGDTEANRTPIGRPIADNPQSLAAASPAKLASVPASDSINSGMQCSQNAEVRPVTVQPVDFKSLAGSYAGDHRIPTRDGVTDSLRQASGSEKGPREQGHGQRNSKFYREDGKAFQSTSNGADSDQGN